MIDASQIEKLAEGLYAKQRMVDDRNSISGASVYFVPDRGERLKAKRELLEIFENDPDKGNRRQAAKFIVDWYRMGMGRPLIENIKNRGLPEEIETRLESLYAAAGYSRRRLWCDRHFVLSGFGIAIIWTPVVICGAYGLYQLLKHFSE